MSTRRRTDHGDPPARPQQVRDPLIVEDVDIEAAFLKGDQLMELGARPDIDYDVPSRSYGSPSAAGGVLRPTRPARITIVTRYGRAS